MTAVRHTETLRPGRCFTVYDDQGIALATYVFVGWEQDRLIAVVVRDGVQFTLGMEPGMNGVDESVPHDASFVALGRAQRALRESLSPA